MGCLLHSSSIQFFYSDEESKSRQKEDHKVLFFSFVVAVFSFTVLTELSAHSVVLELISCLCYFVSCVF